jgi:3-keto-5-aminohexanoate cleavage enzyme
MRKRQMGKMIVTATTANSWLHPELKNWAETPEALVEDAVACAGAGAAILHIHLPRSSEATGIVSKVRTRTDAIIQAGMSSFPVEERTTDFECGPDMVSCILNHHDEHFVNEHVDRLHTLEEFEKYCRLFEEYGVKPEWEVWHTGSYWNLDYMVEKGWLKGPHVLTMFFGWPGGTWSPPTHDCYFFMVKHMPPDCFHTVSIMGKEQTAIATLAIATGGNVRVGTEDNPFIEEGVPARDNAELVERMVWLSRKMGREIATPEEARAILGLKR